MTAFKHSNYEGFSQLAGDLQGFL